MTILYVFVGGYIFIYGKYKYVILLKCSYTDIRNLLLF